MGLFSFIKNAGKSIFGGDDDSGNKDHKEVMRNRRMQLENVIRDLNLSLENMSLDLEGDKITVYGQAPSQETKEKIILALGNVEGISTVDDRITVVKEEPSATFYEVKKGDTLSKIAKEHYGDAMKYNIIFKANEPLLKDPDKIYPGQVLRIPAQDPVRT